MKVKRYAILTGIFLVLLGVVFVGLQIYLWFVSNAETKNLLNTVQESVEVTVTTENSANQNLAVSKLDFVTVDFADLKKRNSDVVSWLKYDTLGINIPIVQTVDNEYYLDRDLDKNKSKLGWVFADVRSNMESLGFNTVLYGHNASNMQMFGSLKTIMNQKMPLTEEQKIIQFSTPYSEMVFEVVSVYVTDYEDWQYVEQVFVDQEDKDAFLSRMVSMNQKKELEGVNLSSMDKYLTFSTCFGPVGTTKRLVIQARLIAEK